MFDEDSESDFTSEDDNADQILCEICSFQKELSELIILNCKHSFCLICLEEYVLNNFDQTIKCPVQDCNEMLTDIQIRNVLPDKDVLKYERLGLANIPNMHTCILPKCGNVVWYDNTINQYVCTNCSLFNCVKCNASHPSISCKKYQTLSPDKVESMCKSEMKRAKGVLKEKRQNLLSENDKEDLMANDKVFYCVFCDMAIAKGGGVRLRSCDDTICRDCLKCHVKTTSLIPPKCPQNECTSTLQDREIYAILSEEELELYERKNFTRIKLKLERPYQCQQPNCNFFCEITNPKATVLFCSKCNAENCLVCKAVHPKESCDEYKNRIKESDIGINEEYIQKAIDSGECMRCPDCVNLVKKGHGCNWIQCSNCGLELCWILKMRRWGAGGRGDISGGCRCEVDDYCHPDCNGCIPDN